MGRIRLEGLLFLYLIAMCAVVVAAFFIEERPFKEVPGENGAGPTRVYLGHGVTHDAFNTIEIGGDSARHDRILWLGLAFGLLQVAFFVTGIAFGGRKADKVGPLRWPLIVFGLIYAAVFTALVVSYRGYAHTTEHSLYLNLPAPTAWMIYGIWFFPLVFMFLYIVRFNDWTFTDADLERYKAIVAERQSQEPDA